MSDPASIRFNNPGAMWGKGNAIATKWGANKTIGLNDGLGQGNNIAVFPDKVHGAAAQFDLWNSHYNGLTLQAAIERWSGANSWQEYAHTVQTKIGLTAATRVTTAILSSPQGLALMKAQAQWEAGRIYPLTDDQWKQAQDMVFKGIQVPAETNLVAPLIVIGTTGAEVSKLQKLLGCKDTGTYLENSELEFALKLFQVRHNLEPDGKCGQQTWEKLNSAW